MNFYVVSLCSGKIALYPWQLDEIAEISQQMAEQRVRRCSVRGAGFEGQIRTEFASGSMGTLTGTLFVAELEIEGVPVPTKVHYLVRELPEELREGPFITTWRSMKAETHQCPPPLQPN